MKDSEKENELYCADAVEWRLWLNKNHQMADNIWLIIYHQTSDTPSLRYNEAVDEALCFGWIDSKPNKRDAESYYVLFSRRNPKSNWSKVNKEKVAKLIELGKMAPKGLEMVRIAKETGTWSALDDVENLNVPDDMQIAFDANPRSFENWTHFPPSVKRGILEWILNAKKPETREKRIRETVQLAEENIRANQYRQPKRK